MRREELLGAAAQRQRAAVWQQIGRGARCGGLQAGPSDRRARGGSRSKGGGLGIAAATGLNSSRERERAMNTSRKQKHTSRFTRKN